MAKLFLFIIVLAVIVMVLRASSRRGKEPPAETDSKEMARCAHCGLHFPRTESLEDAGRDYCSEDHRRIGAKT